MYIMILYFVPTETRQLKVEIWGRLRGEKDEIRYTGMKKDVRLTLGLEIPVNDFGVGRQFTLNCIKRTTIEI